jgi:hypothetical protein
VNPAMAAPDVARAADGKQYLTPSRKGAIWVLVTQLRGGQRYGRPALVAGIADGTVTSFSFGIGAQGE